MLVKLNNVIAPSCTKLHQVAPLLYGTMLDLEGSLKDGSLNGKVKMDEVR